MSEISSRARRRHLQKLTDKIDRVVEADRLFFERFPHRQYRVRFTSRAEIDRQQLIDGRTMKIPPGCRMFTVIRNFAPGFRLCLFIPNLEGADPDLGRSRGARSLRVGGRAVLGVRAAQCRAAGLRS